MKLNSLIVVLAALFATTTARAADWQPVPGNLLTRWAKDVDPQKPLPEYQQANNDLSLYNLL